MSSQLRYASGGRTAARRAKGQDLAATAPEADHGRLDTFNVIRFPPLRGRLTSPGRVDLNCSPKGFTSSVSKGSAMVLSLDQGFRRVPHTGTVLWPPWQLFPHAVDMDRSNVGKYWGVV